MSEFAPQPQEQGDINENAITREEMLKIRDQAQSEAAQVSTSEDSRFDNLFGPDDGKPFNPEDAAVRPEMTEAARMNKARTAADYKYQSVRNAGATHAEAEAAADRVWKHAGF